MEKEQEQEDGFAIEYTNMEQEELRNKIEETLTQSRFQFAIESLQNVTKMKQERNFFFSPHSIYELLCMVYFGSTGSTEISLREILHLSDLLIYASKADLEQQYSNFKYSRLISKDEDLYECYGDSNCWITNSKLLKNSAQHLLKSKLEIINFRKFSNTLLPRINYSWEKIMEGYIHQIMKLIKVTKNMELILSSVVRIKEKFKNFQEIVKLGTGIPRSPRIVLSYKLSMIVNELPFQNKMESLFLLFPAKMSPTKTKRKIRFESSDDILQLVERLATEEGIDELRKVLDGDEALPPVNPIIRPLVLEFADELPIDELLRTLGAEDLLKLEKNHLQNFVSEGQNLHLGDAVHRAFISVTPSERTIASAITVLFTKNEGFFQPMDEVNTTKCKYSFVLLIYDRSSHTILFLGAINNKHDDINEEKLSFLHSLPSKEEKKSRLRAASFCM